MKERLLHTPEGVRDIYGNEFARKLDIQQILRTVMNKYGFDGIETPSFEYYDIFSEERGTVKSKNMYRFFDRDGNMLVLRPDMTPSIARCAAKYYRDEALPLRLSYCGNTFINNHEYQGKQKEITQAGCELINDSSLAADAEMLAVTVECLLQCGLTEFKLEVGQVQFFKALISEAGLDEEKTDVLRHLIIDKNSFGLEQFLADEKINNNIKQLLTRLPQLFGGIESLEEIKRLTSNPDAVHAIEHLERLYSLMKEYGYERYIGFDLGMLSKYNYYTGIIFQVYTYGVGEPIASGGRYDRLVGQFGNEAAAIGMAIIVDRIMLALSRQGIEKSPEGSTILVAANKDKEAEAAAKACRLRAEGKNVCIYISGENITQKDIEALAGQNDKYVSVVFCG